MIYNNASVIITIRVRYQIGSKVKLITCIYSMDLFFMTFLNVNRVKPLIEINSQLTSRMKNIHCLRIIKIKVSFFWTFDQVRKQHQRQRKRE